MAERTGNGVPWQPMKGADKARLMELGGLLRDRRVELGYRHVPAFVRARDINSRMAGDIEHGRRDTYERPTLDDIAGAYEVTRDSMMDVVWSGAGELVPAEDEVRKLDPPGEDTPPMTPEQAAADRPWYDPVNERRFALAARGIIDPSGAQMFPDSPDDAKAWDGIGARMPVGDRVWFIARLRRLAAGRVPNSGTGAAGA